MNGTAIIWDFDGTLIPFDSEQYMLSSLSLPGRRALGARLFIYADRHGWDPGMLKRLYGWCVRGVPLAARTPPFRSRDKNFAICFFDLSPEAGGLARTYVRQDHLTRRCEECRRGKLPRTPHGNVVERTNDAASRNRPR